MHGGDGDNDNDTKCFALLAVNRNLTSQKWKESKSASWAIVWLFYTSSEQLIAKNSVRDTTQGRRLTEAK